MNRVEAAALLQVVLASVLEVMGRHPSRWSNRVVEVVRRLQWGEGEGARLAVMQVWNCWVRLGTKAGGWSEALVILHNSVTDPTDQIHCGLETANVSRPLLDKVRRLLARLRMVSYKTFDLDQEFDS